MTMYGFQLLVGLVALVAWVGVFVAWYVGRTLTPVQALMMVVGFGCALVILPFGSLRLLGVIDDALWTLTGTILRVVVALTGIGALVGARR